MGKKKKIEKSLRSYEKQKDLHKKKIETLGGKKPHLRWYWEKEIEEMDRQIIESKKKLKLN